MTVKKADQQTVAGFVLAARTPIYLKPCRTNMKLYKTTFTDDADTYSKSYASWTGTLAEASKNRKQLKLNGMREIKTDEVEVPTQKAGLIKFLNANS